MLLGCGGQGGGIAGSISAVRASALHRQPPDGQPIRSQLQWRRHRSQMHGRMCARLEGRAPNWRVRVLWVVVLRVEPHLRPIHVSEQN